MNILLRIALILLAPVLVIKIIELIQVLRTPAVLQYSLKAKASLVNTVSNRYPKLESLKFMLSLPGRDEPRYDRAIKFLIKTKYISRDGTILSR